MHTIQKHILALKTKTPALGPTLAEEARILLAGAFHQISEKVFGEFKALPGVLEVPSLTLDLGKFTPDDWAKEAPYRYETTLRKALQELLAARASGLSMWQKPEEAAFALWEYYLQRGNLPWWYASAWAVLVPENKPGIFSLQALAQWLQREYPSAFYAFWKTLPRQAKPWQRLLHHFSDEALWQFSEPLFREGKTLAPLIQASFSQLRRLPYEKAKALRPQLWVWLLENAASASTARRFWRAWQHHLQQVLQPLSASPTWEAYWLALQQQLASTQTPATAFALASGPSFCLC
ncbi:MAG: hypothetical protein HC913_00800 [Microscillaceae bacterium]|nr:hypothetical protein [Microscillaceae bacterium]